MDKSLAELKRVAKMIDAQKMIDEKIQDGKNEPIQEIKNLRTRKDSLESSLADLQREEKELNLRLKIIKKKEDLEKLQEKLDVKLEEERFYEEKPDKEGYIALREDKWAREFDDLILKLKQVEDEEANGTIDEETASEQKSLLTKEIKRLVSIKKKNKSRNNMNKLRRGLKKVTGGISSFSNEMSKISREIGQVGGGSTGNFGFSGGGSSTDWNNFFNDKPARTSTEKTGKKRRRKSKGKKGKKGKKRKRKSKSTATTTSSQSSSDIFGGF